MPAFSSNHLPKAKEKPGFPSSGKYAGVFCNELPTLDQETKVPNWHFVITKMKKSSEMRSCHTVHIYDFPIDLHIHYLNRTLHCLLLGKHHRPQF